MIWFFIAFFAFHDFCVEANHSSHIKYVYRQETGGSYYFHNERRNWFTAREICQSEDADLVEVESATEAQVIAEMIKKSTYISIYIGIHSLLAQRDFRTVTGVPIHAGYDNWDEGQPDNHGGIENCVEFRKNQRLNDLSCYLPYPFICKLREEKNHGKSRCNRPYKDYYLDYETGRCYKVHTKQLYWKIAYQVCKSEESHLAVIYTKEIADLFVQLVRPHGPNTNKVEVVHLGFHNLFEIGYETVMGEQVDSLDYHVWAHKKPHFKCGAMTHNGKLIDIDCGLKRMFICEHDQADKRILPYKHPSPSPDKSALGYPYRAEILND